MLKFIFSFVVHFFKIVDILPYRLAKSAFIYSWVFWMHFFQLWSLIFYRLYSIHTNNSIHWNRIKMHIRWINHSSFPRRTMSRPYLMRKSVRNFLCKHWHHWANIIFVYRELDLYVKSFKVIHKWKVTVLYDINIDEIIVLLVSKWYSLDIHSW